MRSIAEARAPGADEQQLYADARDSARVWDLCKATVLWPPGSETQSLMGAAAAMADVRAEWSSDHVQEQCVALRARCTCGRSQH